MSFNLVTRFMFESVSSDLVHDEDDTTCATGSGSRKRLRILHCLRAPVGGLFRHVRDLAELQSQQGHLVGVICDSQANDTLTDKRLAELSKHLALGLHRTAMPRGLGVSDWSATAATRRLAQSLHVDVLHGHGAKGGAYARLGARALRNHGRAVRTVYTPHGGSLHYSPRSPQGILFMALERRLLSVTDALIFESRYSMDRYARQVREPACRVSVVHNGLTDDEFVEHTPSADARDIVFVGELRKLKGVDLLLRAIASLGAERPMTAAIVGDGADRAEFEALARSLGVDDRVAFLGARPARDAFNLGHCLVMPSRAESLPYIVLEAAAAGIPLIATDVGGIPEIVRGTDTQLVASDDVDGLAGVIRATRDYPAAAMARARQLKAHVHRHFSLGTMAANVEAIYRDILLQD